MWLAAAPKSFSMTNLTYGRGNQETFKVDSIAIAIVLSLTNVRT